jgi:Lhr-like helicase
MERSIEETINKLKESLRKYIEATYHISHPTIIKQRRDLLDQIGVISQNPYLESTPRYKTKKSFGDLNLPSEVLEIFATVSKSHNGLPKMIHDPPYEHQALSVQKALNSKKSLFVITGTGSGKTECYLLPILGKLAIEAKNKGEEFKRGPGVRALILYPMNALVNDQLGRIRLLFGDSRIRNKFSAWSGRPARFGRYTSRTLYPGVRNKIKDSQNLSSLEKYYIKHLEDAEDPSLPREQQQRAEKLRKALQERGKWPQKPNLREWYGQKNTRWKDSGTGEWKRCVTLPEDTELLTRHEIQAAPPDILITNYSMLEYMLMRPIEQPIFDLTETWLRKNPEECLLLVMDEAHLYRGAGGSEVALLIRRLRARLDIPIERLQVICTSASFGEVEEASKFGSQLTGIPVNQFETIKSDFDWKENPGDGTPEDAEALNKVDLKRFYNAVPSEKIKEVKTFLEYRSIRRDEPLEISLYNSLVNFPVMKKLINITMGKAKRVDTLGQELFKNVDRETSEKALTAIVALACFARKNLDEPGLLPCRVHAFFRGLTGLWACMDVNCNQKKVEYADSPCGKLYTQPRSACFCGARVLEFFTCRRCGSAYARAYTDNFEDPQYLWSEAGIDTGETNPREGLEPLDLLLESPKRDVEPANYDLITGRLNPERLGDRSRTVYLKNNRSNDDAANHPGQFVPCGRCGAGKKERPSEIQDHLTKGDQPFQALITEQLMVQPPCKEKTKFSPLGGRKVLVFSDSRQTAARLAPTLKGYSLKDTMRPLIVSGFNRFRALDQRLSLNDLYMVVLIEANILGVRLRPELNEGESFDAVYEEVGKKVAGDILNRREELFELKSDLRAKSPCLALQEAWFFCLTDKYLGLEALALASIVERSSHTEEIKEFPDVPGVATVPEQKLALARVWIRYWQAGNLNFWLDQMPGNWWRNEVQEHKGNFNSMGRFLSSPQAKDIFKNEWLQPLLDRFAERRGDNKYRLRGSELSISIEEDWAYCNQCRETQHPFPGIRRCVYCGEDSVENINPRTDPTFQARKAYYRKSTEELLELNTSPMTLTAAEHTAQLNAAHADQVFAKGEENELLFQDVDLGLDTNPFAIDVISCTTTMEVGIDIGELSGVSLRNMPPARSNYQQRAGRAGRRGTALATVTAFGSADSHDEQYFNHPEQMICGKVKDPALILDNIEISQRHVVAYLLQRYHRSKLRDDMGDIHQNLFSVLGKVEEFKNNDSLLNRFDFEAWLVANEATLKNDINLWLPVELDKGRENLLKNIIKTTLRLIDQAID